MSELKTVFTPGPWEPEASAGSFWVTAYDGRDLALVMHIDPQTRQELPTTANARLLAAAPELLKALKEITARFTDLLGPGLEDGEGNGQLAGDGEAIASARAAIVKAERGDA